VEVRLSELRELDEGEPPRRYAREPEARRLGRRAFLAVSFLSLFLEVLLIRWCGSEVRILAYLKNLTLLACFLGLGLGYAASAREQLGLRWSFAATAVLVGLTHPVLATYPFGVRRLSKLLNFGDMNTWTPNIRGALEFVGGMTILCVLYALLAFAFVPLGQALGSHFRSLEPKERLRHYTENVVASLAGVVAFAILSWIEAPPLAWFAVAAVAALLSVPVRPASVLSVVIGTAAVGGILIDAERSPAVLENDVTGVAPQSRKVLETRWSPYQKIQLVEESYDYERPKGSPLMDGALGSAGPPRLEWNDYSAWVNGEWYSRVGNVDLDTARTRSAYAQNMAFLENQTILRLPYHLAKGRRSALLLGAGMGRDAATALAEGVERVDCVEIESRFVDWGKRWNPQHAYEDERVHVHVDDARRFLRACPPGSYDLVIFCYLDAHSLTSNFTNTNLDSYVYTRESMAEAKRALDPDRGVLAIGFWSPRPFIYRRIETLLEETFGAPPLRFSESLFVTGVEPAPVLRARARRDPILSHNLSTLASEEPSYGAPPVETTSDDWPFFYVEQRTVPWVYRAVLLAILVLSAAGVRAAVGRVRRIDPHFLFLGAAFMLVETWSISRASLVYGATWYVSSAVIASLLVMVLAANTFVEKRGNVALSHAFPLLLGALLAAALLDPSRFLDLPRGLQLLLAAPLYAVPFCFSSAIFATSFNRAERVDEALASNILGSVLGGALECLAFATGLRSLGFVALGLYVLAWITARR
jgi:hypothetical protein